MCWAWLCASKGIILRGRYGIWVDYYFSIAMVFTRESMTGNSLSVLCSNLAFRKCVALLL